MSASLIGRLGSSAFRLSIDTVSMSLTSEATSIFTLGQVGQRLGETLDFVKPTGCFNRRSSAPDRWRRAR
jgi:hypothetical protein